ncbi:DUF4126 domain-containing protein [Mycobacterium sp. CBMA 234]|uniref:DUF4126 family protein n=1 Tax=Mycolicibacterium sp. CBMA 234 TaxID=1918495 RepID=UPI001391D974|nr:DUF4126 family protein [Mycolicibacterium sp. CBMA 234]MUL65433.1 DUF4126 domain-containing protein [Mycolicibacterium sp. CBMA 234]
MTQALVLLFALLIGVVAGLRALTPPAVVAWGAKLGWLPLTGTWAEWVGHPITVTVLTILLVVELVTDQLPSTPPRTVPPQFVARLVTGAFAGAVVGAGWHHTFIGMGAGMIGAVLGTMAGFHARRILVQRTGGRDLPVALAEDVLAVGGGFVVVASVLTAIGPYVLH